MERLNADYLTSPEVQKQFLNTLEGIPVMKYDFKIGKRRAAVMMLLCIHKDGKMSVLYTLRSSNLKSHAGQVSFPGGKSDREDKSVVETAIRETEEELGIPKHVIEVWGQSRFYLPSLNYELTVFLVVGVIRNFDDVQMNPNKDEVEEVFLVSLEKLCDRQYFGFNEINGGFVFPVYMGGKHKIWGLTATFTHLILSCLIPEDLYPMHFQYLGMPNKSKM